MSIPFLLWLDDDDDYAHDTDDTMRRDETMRRNFAQARSFCSKQSQKTFENHVLHLYALRSGPRKH